jgi:AbrB family looped-hinge helix DNA binding protein
MDGHTGALNVRRFYLTFKARGLRSAMSILTVTAKGQVTLRKDLLEHLGVHPGEKITVNKLPDGKIEVKAARPTGKISDVFGLLKRKGGPSLTIEEMNKIAARGWAGKR